jgi:hypothetical protein
MATDNLTASEKVDVFNKAMKPLEAHKKQFQSGKFEGTGMKDETISSFTEGAIPQTEAQEKTAAREKFLKKAVYDPALVIPRTAWNFFAPKAWEKPLGEPFGFTTPGTRVQQDQRKAELQQMKLYRAAQGKVRDDILMLADTAQKRFMETGETKYLDAVVQAKNDIFNAHNMTDDNFVTISPNMWGLVDDAGFFTNSPNPHPMIENMAKFGGGWYGMVKGEKLMNKHFVEKFLKETKKAGGNSKKRWLARTAGAVLGGASAVAVADFGNEVMLDVMNRAGQAKKWMKDDNIRVGMWDAILAENVPDALTFGGEGINRPSFDERKKEAFEAFTWDAAITSAFFGARPLYYGLRRGIGAWPFKMFKPRPTKDPGVVSNLELLEQEQALITKYLNPKAVKEMGLKPIGEPLVFNAPFGKFMWKVVNSNAPFNPFRWMGPQGAIKKGSDEWWPEPTELMGTQLGRHMVGGQVAPGMASTMSPAPLFGTGIRDNMATRGDFYIKVIGEEMLGKFAPYAKAGDMALDWSILASKSLNGFKTHAKNLEKIFDESAEGAGKIFSDENMVTVGKQALSNFRSKLQVDSRGELIPPEIPQKAIDFIERQILKPVGEGNVLGTNSVRTLAQMKGIREGMDDLLKPLQDQTLAETAYADDITRLFKAWETDMGSVANMGYPEVVKAWNDYENFVSKGMLLWMTDVGKAVNKIQTRGFDIVLQKDPTRAGEQLFDVVVKAAQAHPERGASELAALKRIVGPQAYHNGVASYIRKVFNKSIGVKSGLLHFDATGFRKSLGIGEEGSALKSLMEEALPGPKVAKLEIFDPLTNSFKHFDDELYASGVNQGLKQMGDNAEIPAGFLRAEDRILPTTKEFEHLSNILERLFVNGVPDPSKFMMRRAIMSGTRNSLKALLPTQALGVGPKEGAGLAAGAIGMGWMPAAGLAWLVNYGGRVLTNPPSLRVFMNMMDANLPETIRMANFARLVRMYPEEWMEFDKDLAEMEQAQRQLNTQSQATQHSKSTMGKLAEQVNKAATSIKEGADKVLPWVDWANPSAYEALTEEKDETPAPDLGDSMYAPQAPLSYDSSKVGSSITNNPVMNPAAAASLYAGNTDQALANQFAGGATQYAADGGIMNAVMDNKGKFTPVQKGINDNPFQNANNKGITGIL